MKKTLYFFLAVSTLLISYGCSDTSYSPTSTYNYNTPTPMNTATPTPTGSLTATPTPTGSPTAAAPVTFSVGTASSGLSSTGFIYTSSAGSNGAGGLLTISTAHVGDVIQLPGSGTHPLYFDAGSSTCIYMGSTSNQTYTFPSTGTYYFHCGNHGSGCAGGNGVCGSTTCTSMAGVVQVN